MVSQTLAAVDDRSQVGAARRLAVQMAAALEFDATATGRVALCVTELGTNLIKHAVTGKILLRGIERAGVSGLEVIALDRGPGIRDLWLSLRDGHSTAGSMGMGLGALQRSSTAFDVYSQPGRGTAVRLEIWPAQPPAAQPIEWGAVSVPMAGEEVCGDQWAVRQGDGCQIVLVADGLGHGVLAAEAARAAVGTLRDVPPCTPGALLERCHGALRRTRGAAVGIACLMPRQQRGVFAGVGNISCRLESAQSRQQLVSHGGTIGHAMRRAQEFPFDFPAGALLILSSDGLASRWTLEDYPALAARHPGLIAGVLYRDQDRGRDDVTVVVLKNTVQ